MLPHRNYFMDLIVSWNYLLYFTWSSCTFLFIWKSNWLPYKTKFIWVRFRAGMASFYQSNWMTINRKYFRLNDNFLMFVISFHTTLWDKLLDDFEFHLQTQRHFWVNIWRVYHRNLTHRPMKYYMLSWVSSWNLFRVDGRYLISIK